MAGVGSRFRQAGYSHPKYKIEVCGANLFEWSMKSLKTFNNDTNTFIFIIRRDENSKEFIVNECRKINIKKFEILEIEAETDGQATTALLAKNILINKNSEIVIFNIDTYINPNFLNPINIKGHGWLPCFHSKKGCYSYVKTDLTDKVTEVREKIRISNNASVGFYYFKSFELYETCYNSFYEGTIEIFEKFIAPLYNVIIEKGLSVYIHQIPCSEVLVLGTPEDVQKYENIVKCAEVSSIVLE